MRKLIVVIAVAALLGALLVGVGIASGSDVSAATTKPVTIEDNSYTPHKFSIHRNSIVKWTWASDVINDHTVTQADRHFAPKAHGFGSAEQTAGDPPFRHRFKRAGTYYIVCMVHPTEMHMKIVVR